MDNSNSNFPNTQSTAPVNDNNQNPVTDYNSVQPQSNPLGVLPDTSSTTMDTSTVDALSGEPSALDTQPVGETVQPSVGNIPPAEATPVDGFSSSTSTTESLTPLTSDAMSTLGGLNTESVVPVSNDTTAPAFDTATPTVEPTMPSFDTQSSTPVEEQSTNLSETVTTPVETPAADTTSPSAFSAPNSFDTSLNLNEPLQTSPAEDVSAPAQEFVNTLGESEKEEGGSNAVIIILVVIIVLLLAGIGYFGYQIFFA